MTNSSQATKVPVNSGNIPTININILKKNHIILIYTRSYTWILPAANCRKIRLRRFACTLDENSRTATPPTSRITWYNLRWADTARHNIINVFKLVRHQASSSPKLRHTGVPQGSVLGPILFLYYISPISFTADKYGISIQQYADDTQLYVLLTATDIHARQSLWLPICFAQLVLSKQPGPQQHNLFWFVLANVYAFSILLAHNLQ